MHAKDTAQPRNEIGHEAARLRAWLQEVLRRTGLKPTPFAQRAGIAPSTLIRALDPERGSLLDRRTIMKICTTFGVAGPDGGSVAGADLATPDDDAGGTETEALPANQYLRLVASRVLELAGYLPGDLLTLDQSPAPVAGDAVDAQIYSAEGAETVFRLYDPPYLVAATADRALATKPLLVDGERVRIAAVVVRMQRFPRKAPR